MVLKNYIKEYNGDGGKTTPEARQRQAYEFFISKGYKPEIASGIVGNLIQESTTNLKTSIRGFDGTGSVGLAQWLGSRQDTLKEVQGDKWNTFQGQLNHIDWELNNTEKRAFQKLQEAKSPEDAALAFSKYYERPHKDYAHNDKRANYAKNLFETLNKKSKAEVPQEEVIEKTQDKIKESNFVFDVLGEEKIQPKPKQDILDLESIISNYEKSKEAEKQMISKSFKNNSQPIKQQEINVEALVSQMFNDPNYNNVRLED